MTVLKPTFFKKTISILALLLLIFAQFILFFTFLNPALKANAQSQTNLINLRISKVEKNGQTIDTKLVSQNSWSFGGVLNDSDAIKYQWTGVDLQVKFRKTPARSGGFLKVYLNDDSTEENYLIDSGSDSYPLKIADIKDRLQVGLNRLMFVYIDDKLLPANPATKVVFSFNYQQGKAEPELNVLKPTTGEPFVKDAKKEIKLEISNFNLAQNFTDSPDTGKLNIFYANQEGQRTLLTTLPNGLEKITRIDANKINLQITSDNISKLAEVPDSDNAKLIFSLQSKNTEVVSEKSVDIKTNFQESIDVGLPTVEFIEPSQNASDTEVNGNRNFLLKVRNFKLLEEAPVGNEVGKNGEGFLQIFVNDKPLQTFWSKTQFSLNEIGYIQNQPAKIKVRVQLVDTNFNRLSPEAKSEVGVNYIPQVRIEQQARTTQPNNWRIVVIAIIVLVIISGTAFLIARG
jgi:hypothetical protein